MPMRQECLDSVSAILGRELTNAEGDKILSDIRATMSTLSRTEKNWTSMTHDQRVTAAAKRMADSIQQRALKKKQNLILQVVHQNEALTKMKRLSDEEDLHGFKAVGRMMSDIDKQQTGIANDYLSKFFEELNQMNTRWFGMIEDPQDVQDFIREIWGVNTGNQRAKAFAQKWKETAEAMRLRVNEAGGDVGQLDYGYIPQSHDTHKLLRAAKILKTGNKNHKQAWINFIAPLLDRSRYIDENGNAMDEEAFATMLSNAYDRIISNGSLEDDVFQIAKDRPEFLSKRTRFPHRGLHFKSPEAFAEYQSKFAKGSLSSSLISHVQKMASNIALMEAWGPQPLATYELLKYNAEQLQNNATLLKSQGEKVNLWDYKASMGVFINLDDVWNTLTGYVYRTPESNRATADFMQGWRNLEVAGKLGKAFITSFSDIPMYFVTTGFNRLGAVDGAKFLIRAYGSDWREYATRAGIIAESMASDMNRWSTDNIGQGWTGKVAQATMRVSLLNMYTDSTRRAFSLNMMMALGKMVKKNWDELDSFDRARLRDADISEDDWKIFQAAGTEEFKGIEFLNPQLIRNIDGLDDVIKSQVVGKLLSFIVAESEMASLNPDLIIRASATRGEQRGTASGEIGRALFLFKSFPFALMKQHYERAQFLKRHGAKHDRLKYVASIVVSTTLMGAVSLQIQNLLNGKDLQDATSHEFWLSALSKGGGLGFLGDFFANGLSENARYGAWSLASFLGPQASTVLEISDTTIKALGSAMYDKETKPAASALRTIRSHTPFVNLWWTSAAIDRAVMNDLQEWLSPGYIARMESRTERGWGQGYWWNPRSLTPNRAPRMADQPE